MGGTGKRPVHIQMEGIFRRSSEELSEDEIIIAADDDTTR
jgi:hypothetical protein